MIDNKPPMPSPDLGPQDGQDIPPMHDALPAQDTLPVHGPQQKLHEGTPSFQRYRNDAQVPDFAEQNKLDPRAEDARQAVDHALKAGEFKPGARELLTEQPLYRAAMHNDHKPVGGDMDRQVFGKNEDMAQDIDTWLRTNGRVVMIGGYGESKKALQKLAKALAEREGFDPELVDIVTMAEGFKDLEAVRRLVSSAAVVGTHSAGMTVLQKAFEGQEEWLRPGSGYFYNPPSEERRPIGLPASKSQKMTLRQLLTGALIVGDDDNITLGARDGVKWRLGWAGEVMSPRRLWTNIKALPTIVKYARQFGQFTGSLAGKEGTQVTIPVSRWDHFFHLPAEQRAQLEGKGAVVVELPIGRGYHNDALFHSEEAEAAVHDELAVRAEQAPGSPQADAYGAGRRHAKLRRRHARHATHRGAGMEIARSNAASDDTHDQQPVH